jgi:hypothetical protein
VNERKPDRVWPRFESEDEEVYCVWLDPVTGRDVTKYRDGTTACYTSGRFNAPIAEVADRLGIVLEGVNDTPASGTGKDEEGESPVPLAVGQVWRDERQKVEITGINRDEISYRHDLGATGKLFEEMFRANFSILFAPAPEPQLQPPSRDDLIGLLVAGKRLRYERDPESDCRGPWGLVNVVVDGMSGPNWRGVVEPHGHPIHLHAATLVSTNKETAAWAVFDLAESLGYRFASVVDSD